MKKMMFILAVLALAGFPSPVFADGGITNNPNYFEIELNCSGQPPIHVTVPNSYGMTPGFTDDGRVTHPVTFKIDYDWNGTWDIDIMLSHGKAFDTVFCTWTWDRDSYLYGMDIWFSSTK